jgi:TolA-binding protein
MYDKAIDAFQKAIETNSLSKEMTSEAYNRIGDAYYYTKNFDNALNNYNKATTGGIDASSEYALLRSAIIAGDKNQYTTKIALLDELITNYPNSSRIPEAMLEKGNAQVLNGEPAKALNTYAALVKKYQNHPEAREALLRMAITEKNSNISNAITNYWKVIEQYPASIEAQTAAEDLKLIYAERGELTAFSNRLNSIEGGPRIDVREVEKASFEAAENYYFDNNNISKLERYLSDYPRGAYVNEAKYYIGHYYYNKHDYASALDALNDALHGNEDAAFAQRAMELKGAILLEQGNAAEAYHIYQTWATKATNEDNRMTALIGMMNSARESQDWDNVVRCADDLLNSGFTLNSQLEQDALLSKAIANKNLDNTYAAKTDLAALATNTQSEAGAQAAYELAQLYYDEDNLEQAEATLNNLIDSATPHFYWLAKGFILLCDIYNDKGKTQEAIETLRSLKEKYPGHEGEIFNEIDTRLSKWTKRSR